MLAGENSRAQAEIMEDGGVKGVKLEQDPVKISQDVSKSAHI